MSPKNAGPESRPIPILVPISPGRPGVWFPTSGRPTVRPPAPLPRLDPTPRIETRIARREPPEAKAADKSAPMAVLKVTLRLDPARGATAETRILRKPAADAPTEFIPRLTIDERRQRLLELMLEVEAKLEMLDDPVPY